LEPIWDQHREEECDLEECTEDCHDSCIAQLSDTQIEEELLCQICEEKDGEEGSDAASEEGEEDKGDKEKTPPPSKPNPWMEGKACVSCGSAATHTSGGHFGPVCGFCG